MKLILIAGIVWAVSQTIKYVLRLLKGEKFSLSHAGWVYAWGGGGPSTHSAMLTAVLYSIGKESDYNLLFGISFVAALFFIYNLLAEHKKEEVFEGYIKESEDKTLLKIVEEGKILDLSGHSKVDVFFGVFVGLIMGIVLTSII